LGPVFLAFRSPAPGPLSEVRSTIIIGGIQALRARGHYERYLEALAPDVREQMTSLVAGVWIPSDLAIAHYEGADRLKLDRDEVEAIGADVGARMHKSAFSAVTDPAKQPGPPPWKLLSGVHRSNDLNWRGSDVAIYEEGPKQALYEWTDQPCASVPYFVTSFGGYMVAVLKLGCARASYRARAERGALTTLSMRFNWT
jgi:hypothetical protein